MKQLSWILALMLILCACASAEAALPGGVTLKEGEAASIDLDGDGAAEEVRWVMTPGDYGALVVEVTGADGATVRFETGIAWGGNGWVADLDGDGRMEIFAWGDVMSDDYYTWCLHWMGDRLAPALFRDIERGENGEGYYKWGYGSLTAADPDAGTVTLCGTQDVLGTYFVERTLKLSPDGLFEIADDGWWTREAPAPGEEWDECTGLTLKAEVPCTLDGKPATLEPGDRIFITGSDKRQQAAFVTPDGHTGTLDIDWNYDDWGWKVNDIPESDVFEFVPYAD